MHFYSYSTLESEFGSLVFVGEFSKYVDFSFHFGEENFVSVKISVFIFHSVIQEVIWEDATKPDDITKI